MKYTNLTVRVWVDQMNLLKKAAKEGNLSIAEYVRGRLMPLAAKDAGVELPEWPSLNKRGRPSVQSRVAAAMGMPVEEWRKQVLAQVAETALKQMGSGAPPPHTKRTKTG